MGLIHYILLMLVTLLATVDLTIILIKKVLFVPPHFLVGVDQALDLFGLFLNIGFKQVVQKRH